MIQFVQISKQVDQSELASIVIDADFRPWRYKYPTVLGYWAGLIFTIVLRILHQEQWSQCVKLSSDYISVIWFIGIMFHGSEKISLKEAPWVPQKRSQVVM